MNTKTQESNKNQIPLLIRSAQWKVSEKTENQITAVCFKSKQDDIIMLLNRKVEQQSILIEQLNQMMNQQNRKNDDLNDQLHLQDNLNTELQNNAVDSPSSNSRTAILMTDSNEGFNATVFGSSINRSEVSFICTKNTLTNVPSYAWDVSADKDGSVMAWTESSADKMILYLAADGDIYANPDSSNLFANYTRLSVADFTNLKTDLVTNMRGMFQECRNVKHLNLSHWNVSNVTNMCFMFYNCKQLDTLILPQWDISNVTTLAFMFGKCIQLKTLDISHWNVSNALNMDYMFYNCKAVGQMKKGELSSWKRNSSVTMKNICGGTKYAQNPMILFKK